MLKALSRNKQCRKKISAGFSLAEVLVTVGIFVIVVTGLIQLFIYCSALSEMSGNMSYALTKAEDKLEEIRNHSYDQIVTDYNSGGTPGNIFNLSSLNAVGVVYINASNTNLLEIETDVSWRNQKDDRVVGEDRDLDGVLDAGEDINGNGKLDSVAKLITYVAKR